MRSSSSDRSPLASQLGEVPAPL
ncbi:hypothetical protein, partial [Pseudomonas aeruginosa]